MSKVVEIKSGKDLESLSLASEIASEEDFSDVLLSASMDGILAYDLNRVYTLWNPIMERISGMKSKDVVGRKAEDVFPFLNAPEMQKQYEVSLNGAAIRSPVVRYTVPDTGHSGFIQQHNFPLFNEKGEVTGGLAIVREVSAIKQRFDRLHEQRRELENRVKELESLLEKRKAENAK